MAKGFKHGAGGGASLNFKVVGGTTEPASPKENTIWVNTDVEITDWVFSATEPGSSDVMVLSVISGSPWYLSAPQSLSAGDVLNFEIPENVSNTYEAINIADPTTGDEYFVRNSDGSACNAWVKGTKVSVVLSNDTNKLNGYGGNAKTAYIRSYGSYGMTEGMVWFTTGTDSNIAFNALKKNGITVYPLSAKQYVGGAWVEKTAKSYQNGEWVDWCTYLFMGGNQYEQLTGGWKIDRSAGISVTIGQTINFEIIMASSRDAAVFTNNKVNLTNFKTLEFVAEVTSVGNVHVGITTNNSGSVPTFTAKKTITKTGQHIATVDLESIYGEYYVGIHCDAAAAKFSQIRLL